MTWIWGEGWYTRRQTGSTEADPRFTHSPIHPFTGFTLIELLVVMSILALLVLLAQPRIAHWIVSSKESALREDLLVMRKAIDQHYADKGKYPDALADLVSAKYIRAIPRDPFTESADTWITLPAEGEETGTIDVKSGAPGTGIDGVPYKDW